MVDALKAMDATEAPPRVRVRTPGKHIVLFSLAVTFMIALSTLALSKADLSMPAQPFAAAPKAIAETFVVDLSPDAQGRLRLLKLTVEIDAADADARRAFEERRAAVRERVSFFLRELSPEDLDGSAAQERLNAELQRRINLSLAPAAASAVTIQSIVLQ